MSLDVVGDNVEVDSTLGAILNLNSLTMGMGADGVGSKNLQAGNLVQDRDFFALFSGISLLLPLIYLTITRFWGKMRTELPPENQKEVNQTRKWCAGTKKMVSVPIA